MWNEFTADIKCPRGDCLHTKCTADEPPCSACTCNQYSDNLCRTFRYEPKGLQESRKEEQDDRRTT